MNAQQLQSIIRAILLSGGTVIVGKGITDEATWTSVVGFIVGIVPLIWSWFRHAQPPGSLPSTPPSPLSRTPLMLLTLCGFLAAGFFVSGGCATANVAAYKVVATTGVSVDTAMSEWGAYVASVPRTNSAVVLALSAQEQSVKSAYQKYQASFVVVCDAGAAYAAASVTNAAGSSPAQLALQNAESNASQDISDLESLIGSFGVKLQ